MDFCEEVARGKKLGLNLSEKNVSSERECSDGKEEARRRSFLGEATRLRESVLKSRVYVDLKIRWQIWRSLYF